MKTKGPIITLAAGLVVAAALMVINISVTSRRDAQDAAAAQNAAASPAEPTVTTTPAPAETTPPAPPATYAGTVSGGAATIAIATKDGEAIAYLCDGRNIEAWLHGSATNGELLLSSPAGAKLVGVFDTDTAAGEVTVGKRSFEFEVAQVRPPSGLYRAAAQVRDADFVGGWIVVDGEQVGLGVLGGEVVAVPPVDPASATVSVDGVVLTVDNIDGSEG